MATLTDEIAALEAEHRDYFIAEGEQGSRGAEEQLDKFLAEWDVTHRVLMDMWGRWTRVGIPIATNDLAHIRREVEKVKQECCWPRKAVSEAAWQALKAAEQAEAA